MEDKIKIILQFLVAEIDQHLPEINKAVKNWDGSTYSALDRDDLLSLQRACNSIKVVEKFFGLTEAERIIKRVGNGAGNFNSNSDYLTIG